MKKIPADECVLLTCEIKTSQFCYMASPQGSVYDPENKARYLD